MRECVVSGRLWSNYQIQTGGWMRLEGKVAIVTGGAQGIGKAYCRGLAREGAKVVIGDIKFDLCKKLSEEMKKEGFETLPVKLDVSDEKDTLGMADDTLEKFGRIDILINNAAIYPLCKFTELTYEQWKKVLAVNLDGVFLCMKAVVPQMIRQKKGKIISISTECFFMGYGELVDYTASKAGIVGFSRALAEALGEYNINVNTVTPGLTASENVITQQPYNFAPHIAGQSIKRRQEPEDLVGTIVFLSSSDSDMITGQIINVDGGYNKH
jgi:3-oxoacyl-[acyl-carrier protein] reductase